MATNKNKHGLGKGLSALIPSAANYAGNDNNDRSVPADLQATSKIGMMVKTSSIVKNPFQPRKVFNQDALDDLKNSIREHGIIQPLTVRKAAHGFELIAGERRLRAAKEINLKEVPVYVLDVEDDAKMLEMALIENIQREDLNPIETANGYQRLVEECGLTQEQIAKKVGKDRSTVTNFIRLLKLPEKLHESLRIKEITMGHARALLGVSDPDSCIALWKLVTKKNLSVRATEAYVKDIESGKLKLSPDNETFIKPGLQNDAISEKIRAILEDNENKLRHLYGTDVSIKYKNENRGNISFEYYSKEDLNRLLELLASINDL